MRTFLFAVIVLSISGCAADRGYGPRGQGAPPQGGGLGNVTPQGNPPAAHAGLPSNVVEGSEADGPIDPRAASLLSDFLAALQRNAGDMNAAARAAAPYLHKSLLNPADPNDVNDDLKRFSFKKAWQNAHFYANPVNITRVRRSNVTAIGHGGTGEAGTVVDYFVGKLNAQQGMPAPVAIFFPKDGGPPKISYVGSL
ncbi:MAG: hypothetical protein U0174_22245 [Polyangiaceae bacterium]